MEHEIREALRKLDRGFYITANPTAQKAFLVETPRHSNWLDWSTFIGLSQAGYVEIANGEYRITKKGHEDLATNPGLVYASIYTAEQSPQPMCAACIEDFRRDGVEVHVRKWETRETDVCYSCTPPPEPDEDEDPYYEQGSPMRDPEAALQEAEDEYSGMILD